MAFQKYTSLESFGHVYKNQQRFDAPARIIYGAKIKLHGTNAAVRISGNGEVTAQSRSRDISVEDDNAGFAAWVKSTEKYWKKLSETIRADETLYFYGEWGGHGIQKNDAVTKLDKKYFFVFSITLKSVLEVSVTTTDPDLIEEMIPDHDDVVVIPWDFIYPEIVNFSDTLKCQEFANFLNSGVESIGEKDPFIYGIFDVSGPGEGWVLSPLTNQGGEYAQWLTTDWYNTLTFKVKCAEHSVKKGPSASVGFIVPENVKDFVETFVTGVRCNQGLYEACDGVLEPERMGAFLKWMNTDIIKESVVELSDMDLTWKDVTKSVTTAARNWFKFKISTLT